MNIKITTVQFDITPALDEYVTKKISPLERFMQNPDILCEVELAKTTNRHKSGDFFKAEANLKFDGRQIYAVEETADIYASIDALKDELERLIISSKTKKEALWKRGALKFKELLKRIS